jgi:RDD family protein
VVSDRVRAAWIDVVLLALLGVVVSLVAGQGHVGHWTSYDNGFPTDHHGVQINLRGGWFVVWCVMALLYYSTLEAWFGQTIGKTLTATGWRARPLSATGHCRPGVTSRERRQRRDVLACRHRRSRRTRRRCRATARSSRTIAGASCNDPLMHSQ